MEVEYFDWGGSEVSDPQYLSFSVAAVLSACSKNSSCEIISTQANHEGDIQTIIADFADGTYDPLNSPGILRVERLAITHNPNSNLRWDVRALRKDFPLTLHQNDVPPDEPKSLCLYIETWPVLERSWTPELFLKRVFWWLRETANGTIHKDDQPLEQIFFTSPFNVVLPKDYMLNQNMEDRYISFTHINQHQNINSITLIGEYSTKNTNSPSHIPVSILLDPVENVPVEAPPHTLYELHESLLKKNSNLLTPLCQEIREIVSDEGTSDSKDEKEFVLLLIGMPRLRNGSIEKVDIQGFMVESKFGPLGEALSVLFKSPTDGKWYKESLTEESMEGCKNIQLVPVNIRRYPTEENIRQYSGLSIDDDGPSGVIAGVGALGSFLAVTWNRESWGKWRYVDDDIVLPHNLVRHVATYQHVGYPKSLVVDHITQNIYKECQTDISRALVGDIISKDENISAAIDASELLVDSSTTLNVPRTISRHDHYPRTVSTFITPSGKSSVILFEDELRKFRSSTLEAQYYRAILQSDWGENHLTGHSGRLWVGAGCRDVSLAMSSELVHLHGAILARQIRLSSSQPEPRICIFDFDDQTGSVIPHEIKVNQPHCIKLGHWEIHWDNGFVNELKRMRSQSLPNETGGILFGITDYKDSTITLVSACAAPNDSESTPVSFERAPYDSIEVLDQCSDRTAGIVTYIGEWHSHPDSCGALPSEDDVGQLVFLTSSLHYDGMPALMVIISETQLGLYLDKFGVVIGLGQ